MEGILQESTCVWMSRRYCVWEDSDANATPNYSHTLCASFSTWPYMIIVFDDGKASKRCNTTFIQNIPIQTYPKTTFQLIHIFFHFIQIFQMWKWNSFFVMHIKTKQTKGNFDYLQYINYSYKCSHYLMLSHWCQSINRACKTTELSAQIAFFSTI